MYKEKIKKEIVNYFKEEIVDYELRMQLALGIMERDRCPFLMADGGLYDEMIDKAAEYFEDNEIAVEYDMDWEDFIEGEDGLIWVE